ncbi:S8 family serine peptidase [Nonomuraea sp. NPDC049709]|uniref:S8 family serine peptidase n=1 Tax=Nonomuraea sp. NPDC049709 TaxID=3154736 RepID=UPI003416DF72
MVVNSIAPAILPGVLAVGAHRADGAMFLYSNHGPAYAGHGLTTLGEAVLGATPGDGGIKAQKGTCVAVALVTGIAALLVSLQRRLGQPADPLAVRDALLATARPCTPDQSHGEPMRCLNGYLDLPAATARLFPDLPPAPPEPAPSSVEQACAAAGNRSLPPAGGPSPATVAGQPSSPAQATTQAHDAGVPAALFDVRPIRRRDRPIGD